MGFLFSPLGQPWSKKASPRKVFPSAEMPRVGGVKVKGREVPSALRFPNKWRSVIKRSQGVGGVGRDLMGVFGRGVESFSGCCWNPGCSAPANQLWKQRPLGPPLIQQNQANSSSQR